jgi:D-inositol-3-phosphate glycosyltransferase
MRVAMLSVHTCPLAALGGKETGGMNVYVREVSRELGRMGLEVDVFTRSQNREIARVVRLAPGVRVVHLPAGPEAPMPREDVYRHLDEFVDALDAWRLQDGGEYDLVHGHYWLSGLAGLRLRARWGSPLIQMFHTLGQLKNSVARTADELEPELRIASETGIVAAADRIIAANAVERTHLAAYYGASPERVAVIPCGVDTDLFRPADPAGAKAALGVPDGPLLVYVGRLAPIKGLETLFESMARLSVRPFLLIIGGDQDEPQNGHLARLRGLVATLGLADSVRFLGAQRQEQLRLYYAASDATVMPSYYESFGMVALEAMACGSPVIASRVGGLTTTVRDGVTGFLVPDGDRVALAEAIVRVIADGDLRWRLGREAVRWAARYRWPCVAEAVCQQYARFVPEATGHLPAARCT